MASRACQVLWLSAHTPKFNKGTRVKKRLTQNLFWLINPSLSQSYSEVGMMNKGRRYGPIYILSTIKKKSVQYQPRYSSFLKGELAWNQPWLRNSGGGWPNGFGPRPAKCRHRTRNTPSGSNPRAAPSRTRGGIWSSEAVERNRKPLNVSMSSITADPILGMRSVPAMHPRRSCLSGEKDRKSKGAGRKENRLF